MKAAQKTEVKVRPAAKKALKKEKLLAAKKTAKKAKPHVVPRVQMLLNQPAAQKVEQKLLPIAPLRNNSVVS